MNRQHLRAIFWLRWRLLANQLTRGGTFNTVLLALAVIAAVPMMVFLFVLCFFLGWFALAGVSSVNLMYVWDGLIFVFLCMWGAGLLADLQRPEALSLDKLLHLPVSLSGGFILNYLGSLFNLTLMAFTPMLAGLCVGLAVSRGPTLLILLPMLAAFLLMVTAVTYQFQGWLATLMANKNRRRTIAVVVIISLILIVQLPNLMNWLQPLKDQEWAPVITRQTWTQLRQSAWLANVVLPPGWLAYGAMSAADGDLLLAGLCTLGLALVGVASLWRAHRTTVRLYMGAFSANASQPVVADAPLLPADDHPDHLLESKLPRLSEQAAVIALGGFRSLTRAPEAKMLLLSPILMVVIFAGVMMRGPTDPPPIVRPLTAYGAIGMILWTMVQFISNQFGFDRAGFRIFVLGPAARRDILLGKNLALAPLALLLCVIAVALVQAAVPMRLQHLAATVPQFVSMYLLLCLAGNWMAIFAPIAVASGSLKPANPNLLQVLIQMIFLLLVPLFLVPTLLPLGLEFLLETLKWIDGVPLCLVLTLVECAIIIWLYRVVLAWQGEILEWREKRILEIVTTKVE